MNPQGSGRPSDQRRREQERRIQELRDRITAQPKPDQNPREGNGLPVTIVRPNSPGQDIVVEFVVSLIRVLLVRRALNRFYPGNTLSFRDVMIGLAALRAAQVGSSYALWTREPLGWDKRIAATVKQLLGRNDA